MTIFDWIVISLWVIFWSYWAVSARKAKKVKVRLNSPWRYWGMISLIVIVLIIISLRPDLRFGLVSDNNTVMIIGIAVCIIGMIFAVWARIHLGMNWNNEPSIQEFHELVKSGPYQFVRHPIYTGILFALIGTAVIGGLIWWVMFIAVLLMFIWRIKVEESFMMDIFPRDYPEYRKQTKALIPFIWWVL